MGSRRSGVWWTSGGGWGAVGAARGAGGGCRGAGGGPNRAAAGAPAARGEGALGRGWRPGHEPQTGSVPWLAESVALCQRQEAALRLELQRVDAALAARIRAIEAIGRLLTVPGIGPLTATTIYAWVGDVRRFPNPKALAAYAGLVPTVRQSGGGSTHGGDTKPGGATPRRPPGQGAPVGFSGRRGPVGAPPPRDGAR